MKLYRDTHGVIVGTQYEAKRMGKGWEQIDVPVDKQGLIDYLNAIPREQTDRLPAPQIEPTRDEIVNSNTPEMQVKARQLMQPSYTAQSVALDEQWDALPLPRKLDFAALAMEDARNEIAKR